MQRNVNVCMERQVAPIIYSLGLLFRMRLGAVAIIPHGASG